jgi:hypothetical protein
VSDSPEGRKRSRYLRLAAQAAKLGSADNRDDMLEAGLGIAETWLQLASASEAPAASAAATAAGSQGEQQPD